jgi:hypothetical protein
MSHLINECQNDRFGAAVHSFSRSLNLDGCSATPPAGVQAFKPSWEYPFRRNVMKRLNGLSQVVNGNSQSRTIVMIRKAISVILSIVVLITVSVGQDPQVPNSNAPVGPTGQQLNTLISQRATQNVTTYFATQLGAHLSGTWSGTVTDTGWNLTFSGSINGQAAAITETGVLKAKVASWTDSGTVGSTNVTGSGTATLTSNNELKWNQKVGGEGKDGLPLVIWVIIIIVIILVLLPKKASIIAAGQEPKVPGGPAGDILVANQFNLQTGTLFSSSVPQAAQGLTTIQEGSINNQTGTISYDSDTFIPQGSGGLPVGR